ncbi:hypothetical protein [Natronohydrobacter thiooxidans]|uniref:hypothetical protein n=1 Tax=Natronohydrobacter thiooxidans TaxID=87172 RepID=UPI001FE2E48A|nr:hypothetical protein [Natronohydrobacter thiooxidans]
MRGAIFAETASGLRRKSDTEDAETPEWRATSIMVTRSIPRRTRCAFSTSVILPSDFQFTTAQNYPEEWT